MSKVATRFEDNFSITVEGLWIVIAYRGKEYQRQKMSIGSVMFKDYEVYTGSNKGKETLVEVEEGTEAISIAMSEVIKFAQVYSGLQKKYTGRFATYVAPAEGSKKSTRTNWDALTKAAAQAQKNELDYYTYLSMLISHYSRRAKNSGGAISFPFPNQLHGDWAQSVIVEESGRRNARDIPPDVKAERIATTNRYLPLDKDQAFIECRARVKQKTHTEFDIAYLKARFSQTQGVPPDWVLKLEKDFNKTEPNNDD